MPAWQNVGISTGEDYNVLLVRFTLERLLYRLSRSSHREQFVLKGAMLFALWNRRCTASRGIWIFWASDILHQTGWRTSSGSCAAWRSKPMALISIRARSCARHSRPG